MLRHYELSVSIDVSIHAPVMDANKSKLYAVELEHVSIHAPVMDAN